jgi:hypothetical protein
MALPVLHKRGDIVMMVAFDSPTTYVNLCGATSISLNLENAVSEVRVGDCEDWSLPTRVIASYGAQTVNATANAQLARSNRDRLLRWAKDQIALPVRLHIVSAPSGEVEYIDGMGMLATLNVENIGSTDDGAVVTTTLNIRFEDGVEFINSGQVLTAPQFTSMPSLLGSTALGGTITINLGAASGVPAPVLSGTLSRPGAASVAVTQGQQITIASGDQGGSLSLTAVATNSQGTDTETVARSVPAAEPTTAPAITSSPVITGSTTAGGTLSSTLGAASGNPAPNATRQWLADGLAIAGETGATLDTTGRAGQSISLRVTWSNGIGSPAVATSNAIAIVAAATAPVPFAAGDWSLATGLEANHLVVNINALPANGGSPITAIQYSANGGTWTALSGGAGTGPRTLTMPAAATSYSIRLRAVNAVGNSTPGDTKTAASGSEPVVSPDPISALLWVGAFDDSSVTVTASAIMGNGQVQFAAVPVGGGAAIVTGPVTVDPTYSFARATLTGLSGEYDIEVRSAGGAVAPNPGRVRTRPASREAFKIGFASCYWAGQGNNHPIFDTIVDQNPDMRAFYNLGDRGYADISTNSVALYHAADDAAMSLSRAARLHRTLPNLYMWDDHDYGANDSGAASASRAAAVSWFRGRVPMRPVLTGATDAPYYAHSPMPGVTVAMLDTRSERSTGSAQMIGAGQEAWLIGLIEALPLGDVLVINASVPWVATAAADTWSIASAQRQRIADAVTANCPGQVFIIAGDMHALAYDNGTNSVGGIPVAQAAPLGNSTSSKGGPYSTGPIQATQHQYGTLLFAPTADGWTVRFEGWSVDDAGVQTRRIDQTATLEPPAVVDPPAGDAPVLVQTALSPQDATGQVTSVTVNYAQPTEGNLLIAMFGGQSTSLVIPDIAGWNVASYHTGTGFRHKAYWKFAGAGEPTSVTQSVAVGSPRSLSGQVMEFGNVASAYSLLVDTDGSLSATTGLDLGAHSALENAISVAFMIYDTAGASETTSTGPGPDFTSTLNARSNANQRFGAKISTAAENVAASFTLAASVRSGRTLITFNPVV